MREPLIVVENDEQLHVLSAGRSRGGRAHSAAPRCSAHDAALLPVAAILAGVKTEPEGLVHQKNSVTVYPRSARHHHVARGGFIGGFLNSAELALSPAVC